MKIKLFFIIVLLTSFFFGCEHHVYWKGNSDAPGLYQIKVKYNNGTEINIIADTENENNFSIVRGLNVVISHHVVDEKTKYIYVIRVEDILLVESKLIKSYEKKKNI